MPQWGAPQLAVPPTHRSLSWALRRSPCAVQHSYPARITGPAALTAGPVFCVDSTAVAWQRGRISPSGGLRTHQFVEAPFPLPRCAAYGPGYPGVHP